ncbi:snRNA-activating protein complex subunit 3-like [Anneissia japonica]|uniref:snRNA-activating protein complex subunit 3-like n=1 Tax=Anneissia japonica TaxID=1529436 RepID=UPI001425711A|nr:snRNA-activating protein complex subunit 3-like [Anneissia japonica]XP_033120757.1 snRNA-activating protein complex subunit 3-like [Anneissia japonica]
MDASKFFEKFENSSRTNVSDLVQVGSFLEACGQLLEHEDLLPSSFNFGPENEDEEEKQKKSEIGQMMDVPDTTLNELEIVCSPEKLMSGTSADDMCFHDISSSLPKGGEHLMCLRLRKEEKVKRTAVHSNYHKNSFDIRHGAKDSQREIKGSKFLNHPQVVVSIVFLEKSIKCKVDREILVLPEQTLSVLLDKLVCVSDLQVPNEFSDTPDLPQDTRFKSLFKSSFFFIEDTFYNDRSDPLCTDLSQPIINWAQEHSVPGAESFRSADMDEITIGSLKVRLGYPYLYRHQGDCEHIFMFTDIRLLHNNDNQDLDAYPLVVYKHLRYLNTCQICNEHAAKWLTKEDTHISTDPGFFCERCFKMLHYNKDGQKKGSFLAYPYMDIGVYN